MFRKESESVTVSPISIAPFVKPGVPLVKYSNSKAAPLGATVTNGGETSVKTVAVLLVGIVSASPPEIVAVEETVPLLVTATVLVTVKSEPTGRLVTLHVRMLPDRERAPRVVLLETRTEPGGKTWLSNTPLAGLGPRLVALMM